MDLVENQLGEAKGTPLEEAVRETWQDEGREVGWYLAAARQAERDGVPWVAGVFRAIAMDEAAHSARSAELAGEISGSTAENVKKALEGEVAANRDKLEVSHRAKELGLNETAAFFSEAARDEARHAKALMGIYKRK